MKDNFTIDALSRERRIVIIQFAIKGLDDTVRELIEIRRLVWNQKLRQKYADSIEFSLNTEINFYANEAKILADYLAHLEKSQENNEEKS